MDLSKTISDLYIRKQRLERTIAALEELEAGAHGRKGAALPHRRRGRKFMGSEERRSVSERMRNYWAKRRAAAEGG